MLFVHCRCTRRPPPTHTPAAQPCPVEEVSEEEEEVEEVVVTVEEEVREKQTNKSRKKRSAHLRRRAPTGRTCAGPRVDQVAAVCSVARSVGCRRVSLRHSRSLLRPCGCATVSAAECADDAIHSTARRRSPPPPPALRSRIHLYTCVCALHCSVSTLLSHRALSTHHHCDATRCCRSAPLPLRASRSPCSAPLVTSHSTSIRRIRRRPWWWPWWRCWRTRRIRWTSKCTCAQRIPRLRPSVVCPAPRTDSARPHSLTIVRHLLRVHGLSLYCVNRVELQADAAVLVVRPADEVDA